MAKLGANVTGIDTTKDLIEIAIDHAKQNPDLKHLTYRHEAIEEHVKNNVERYDVVVSSEVVEHVTEKELFLGHMMECLKPGGSIFITTISQTLRARWSVIFLAERIFKHIPLGTHEYNKLISPEVLIEMLKRRKG